MSTLLTNTAHEHGASPCRGLMATPSMPMSMSNHADSNADQAKTRWLGDVDSGNLCTEFTGIYSAKRVTTGRLREGLT